MGGRFRYILAFGLGLALVANASAASVKKHALGKVAAVAVAPVEHPVKSAKFLSTRTLGSILFAAEGVVDVIHVGTSAASKVGDVELKHNPLKYADEVVGYADSGMEKAGSFFFGVQL